MASLRGIGPKRAELMDRKLGLHSVYELIHYFPFRYEDRRDLIPMRDLVPGSQCTVAGTVREVRLLDLAKRGLRIPNPATYKPRRGQRLLLELSVADATGQITAKWFNQAYLAARFHPGQELILTGMLRPPKFGRYFEIDNPEFEVLGSADTSTDKSEPESPHIGRMVPFYRGTEGLGTRQIRAAVHLALKAHGHLIKDAMPEEICKRHALPPLAESIRSVHFPPEDVEVSELNRWATPWQRRIVFDEIFMLEAGFAALKRQRQAERGLAMQPPGALLKKYLRGLPYALTGAQERVIGEILADMAIARPMQRLLQGDVGSGKTTVAVAAMLTALEAGYQAALMAPTEILAEQHYGNIHPALEALGLRAALISGGRRKRPLAEIAEGKVDVVVGTHALIEEGVEFAALGLAVIDEQHRFGVLQRAALRKKSVSPHVLIMTATPIPRTLAMSIYGDLDSSVLNQMPPGRSPVKTELITEARKSAAYGAIAEEVAAGGQVYVVYPLIEESDKLGLKSAEVGLEALRRMYPAMRVEMVHGRMKSAEKERIMAGFKAGEIDILVSTTVIEVGVDVPNASLMLIVHAERFGLAQLHQLRGRVGRGRRVSRCLLMSYGPGGEDASRRMAVMCSTTDGFKVAEEDLALRGPGELIGTKQSGVPELRAASLVRDAALFAPIREEAFALLERDPLLAGYPELRAALEGFWSGRAELWATG